MLSLGAVSFPKSPRPLRDVVLTASARKMSFRLAMAIGPAAATSNNTAFGKSTQSEGRPKARRV